MSRCFPFPPPGFEKKKIRPHEPDPLIKEKYKEKKHKKDKDKEKKEGKEKNSKDRSKDKHKERKEKKEKHIDRKDKEKNKEKTKPLEEKKAEVLTKTEHGEKLVTNTEQHNSNGESKYVQDLARRIRYEEEATGSQSAQKIYYLKQRNSGLTEKAFENSRFCPTEETNHREDDDKRINTQKSFAVAKSSENAVALVAFDADQKTAEAMGKSMENRNQASQMESPEKSHRKESDKPRDKEEVKKIEERDKDRRKEKKEGKTESINKTRHEKPKLIGGTKLEEREKDSFDIRNFKPPPDLSRASVKNLIAEGNLGKRKDLETNGYLYENGTTPNKSQRHSASVYSGENGRMLGENGRMLGAHRTPLIPSSEVQGTMCKPEVMEARINGFVVPGEKQNVCPPNSLAATMNVKVKENGAKPPHPDLKYLNQILNVPKRELLVEVDDDQEWLFGHVGVKLKKARTESPESGESLQVWNRAFRVESADIVALPYVVPL